MSSKKVTKTEVDRCIKELQRAITDQDEHMERFKSCSDAHRSEKLLLDMKDHLGKVIRLRHQIKAWLEGKDIREEPIRDKKDLLVQLKDQAEERMEDFDREAKMRSKRAHHHLQVEKEELTEEEQANLDNQAWVREMLQKIRDRKEVVEGELEGIKKKSANASAKKKDQMEEDKAVLTKKIEACNFHIFHLELMLRGLDNHVIDPYDVDSVRYDLEQFLEDGELDQNVYDPLDLSSRLGVLAEEVSAMTKHAAGEKVEGTPKAEGNSGKKASPPSSKGNQEEKMDTPKKEKKAPSAAITTPTTSPTMTTPTAYPHSDSTHPKPTTTPAAKPDADSQRHSELQKHREEELKGSAAGKRSTSSTGMPAGSPIAPVQPTVTTETNNSGGLLLGGTDIAFQQFLELQRQREEDLKKVAVANNINSRPVLDLDIDETKLMFSRGTNDRAMDFEIARQQEEFEKLRLQQLHKQQQQQPQGSPQAPQLQTSTKKTSPLGADLRVSQPFFPQSSPQRPAQQQQQQQPQQQSMAWGQTSRFGLPAQSSQPLTVNELPPPFNPSQQSNMANRQQQMAFEQQRMQQQLMMLEQRHQQQQLFQPPASQSQPPAVAPGQYQQMMDQQRRYQMMLDQQKQYQFLQEQQQKQHHQQFMVVQQEQQQRQQHQAPPSQALKTPMFASQEQPRIALPQLHEPLPVAPASATSATSTSRSGPKEQSSFLSLFSQDQPPSPFVQQQLLKFAKLAPPGGASATSPLPSASPSPSPSPPPDAYQQHPALSEDEQLLITLDATALLESLGLDPILTDQLVKSAIESGARSDVAEASLGSLAINLHRNGVPVDGRQKLIKALSQRKGGPK